MHLSFRPQGEIFLRSLAFARDDMFTTKVAKSTKQKIILSKSFVAFACFVLVGFFLRRSLTTAYCMLEKR
jgi:hypothetical protein